MLAATFRQMTGEHDREASAGNGLLSVSELMPAGTSVLCIMHAALVARGRQRWPQEAQASNKSSLLRK